MLDVVRTTSSKLQLSNQRAEGQSKEDDETDAAKRNKNSFSLVDSINQVITKMEREKEGDSNKRIPGGFIDFARSPMFRDLLEAMLDYNRELFRLENKQQVLE